jgi:hypothetical protein
MGAGRVELGDERVPGLPLRNRIVLVPDGLAAGAAELGLDRIRHREVGRSGCAAYINIPRAIQGDPEPDIVENSS